nr:reverse transcriptase domain-containing protein [Tanacetum cinerariifolium]
DSVVTYSFVYSEARSWSIPYENPYEEAAQQLFEQAPHSPEAGITEADTPPRNRPLLATPRLGCEVGESSVEAARRPGPTMAHRVDCSYVETRLQDTERRMMAALELVNLRVSYQTREALARSEAYCRALEARVTVLETHARRLEWQRQAADDFAVQHIMRTQALEAGACDDTLEDTGPTRARTRSAWIRTSCEEEEEEEEDEEEEIDIEDEMDDSEIIYPYEIEEGELPPLPADSETSSDSEPEVKAEDEDGDEATVGTITRASYSVPPFLGTVYVGSGSSRKVFALGPIGNNVDMLQHKVKCLAQQMFDRANTEYSTLKRLGEIDQYLSGLSTERRSEVREHYKLKQSVSTLEDQMRGLMLEDKEEKEMLKKKLRASQQEKEQIEQAFRQVIEWIRKQFGVEIPPCMGDDDATTPDDAISCNDLYHFVKQCKYVIMPPKAMSQAAIERLITQRVNAALEAERAGRVNEGGEGSNANETRGQDRAPPVRELATLGLNVAIGKSWGDIKKMMLEEFCPDEKTQRMEDELRSLKLKDTNIAAYTQRFHELVLLCPEVVPTEKKKVEAYIKGLPENIK